MSLSSNTHRHARKERRNRLYSTTSPPLLLLLTAECMQPRVLAPLSIGFAVFMVHLATIPITGTGINPARSFGAAVIYNKAEAWDDHVSTLSLDY
ncbi:hypothetical protein CMV_022896 [Castanea mollissima]|uniref:Aquaporin n=1 Tax=Castanea mollissima TaxID=60419 RepID=A0A8J4QD12_9ROSI|nr:hypothetical protein CMV_022896 [Castanea mollissima]